MGAGVGVIYVVGEWYCSGYPSIVIPYRCCSLGDSTRSSIPTNCLPVVKIQDSRSSDLPHFSNQLSTRPPPRPPSSSQRASPLSPFPPLSHTTPHSRGTKLPFCRRRAAARLDLQQTCSLQPLGWLDSRAAARPRLIETRCQLPNWPLATSALGYPPVGSVRILPVERASRQNKGNLGMLTGRRRGYFW